MHLTGKFNLVSFTKPEILQKLFNLIYYWYLILIPTLRGVFKK